METCKSGSERSIWKPITETWKGAGCLLYLYVDAVLKYYQPGSVVSGGGGNPGSSGSKVADVGRQWIGRSTYVFGGGRNTNDIARGIFDCSSFE